MEEHGLMVEASERALTDEAGSNGQEFENVVVKETISYGDNLLKGQVLAFRAKLCERQPNLTCRVESFGRMCSMFDDQRKRWVMEMGFGGLLNMVGLQQPRTLCYWLMSRVDPLNEMFVDVSGQMYRLSSNQVKCVLGIPKGSTPVPSRVVGEDCEKRAVIVEKRYCKVWRDNLRTRKGFPISPKLLDRAEGAWQDEDEEEFKVLFLLLSLQMVLCPTQCPRLPADLIPAVTCAMDACKYDWCDLVLRKLMSSARLFSNNLKSKGYALGCGGCTIFLALFYLDRLARNPLNWGIYPRLKVWSNAEIRKAATEDRHGCNGDFGKIGMLDVAYGEKHPRDARDVVVPDNEIVVDLPTFNSSRRRKGKAKCPRTTYK